MLPDIQVCRGHRPPRPRWGGAAQAAAFRLALAATVLALLLPAAIAQGRSLEWPEIRVEASSVARPLSAS